MDYDFQRIEAKWQDWWEKKQVYKVSEDPSRPKCYVLDMFPYPSGSGLHVGHPLGYIATDVYSRYKRLTGHAVLHPMGFDAFGLPAEQYAIETGQHPATTTKNNIATFTKQLKRIGFDYDWSRTVKTCDPDFFRWTQWIFGQLFSHWYDEAADKAKPISELEADFAVKGGNDFSAADWAEMSDTAKQKVLMNYRLVYLDYADVNWCAELGTVLANDEVVNGLSERGGHPVERKRMRQWFMRTTAYAERLLAGLDEVEWSNSLREMQRNWIGRSEGASCTFKTADDKFEIEIFTTRPDTMFGATFMVLAPEHELVKKITAEQQKKEIEEYLEYVSRRSDRERMTETKTVTGAFTGCYAVNPLTKKQIPIWIADYVLAGYGTGAIMAVPSDDNRDLAFAEKFQLPVIEVIDRSAFPNAEREDKVGTMINSGFINGKNVVDAIDVVINKLEADNIGKRRINYRLRDAGYSRQRYWGEPFPIVYRDDMPYLVDNSALPVTLPELESYKPTGDGRSPIAAVTDWVNLPDGSKRETDTMPGYAGSSWYWLRYMDPDNTNRFVAEEREKYWGQVDLYIGGAEHAVGHLMYSRFWNHVLFDMGLVSHREPFKKLVNQGMIQGRSSFVYRIKGTNKFVSAGLKGDYDSTPVRVDISMVENDVLDTDAFRKWRDEFRDAEFQLEQTPEGSKYICGYEIGKMSKRWHNVVNPDDICEKYGADTLRLYEMFLGPLEQAKPWDTRGIDGAHKFLRRFWRMCFDQDGNIAVVDEKPDDAEFKSLYKAIRKVEDDIERLSFNTAVSAMMTALNELSSSQPKRKIVEPFLIVLCPFAPHFCEEIWQALGNKNSIVLSQWPAVEESYLIEDEFEYPVSVNGKLRDKVLLPLSFSKDEVEKAVLARETIQKWTDGKAPRKVIVVPGRIVNVVV